MLAVVGMAARLAAPGAATAQSDATKDWLVFEDSVLRFKHPKGSVVRDYDVPKAQEHVWIAGEIRSLNKKIRIYQHYDGKEKRPLASIAKGVPNDPSKIIAGPTKVALPGGECLKYRAEWGVIGCGDGFLIDLSNPKRPVSTSKCIRAITKAVCYNKRKVYFEMWSGGSNYVDAGKPDAAAKEDARIFDAILKTVEFK